MRMLLLTAGSRGDVEPFAVLARRARDLGHEVTLALPDNSGVNIDGIAVRSLGADFNRLVTDQGVSPLAAMRNLGTVVRPTMRAVIIESARIGLDVAPEVILAHPKVLSAPLIAGRVGATLWNVEMVPASIPTRAFPAPGTIDGSLGALNALTYRAVAGAAAMFRGEVREAAALLGDPAAVQPRGHLLPISTHILPRPADWPSSVVMTGAWTDEGGGAGDADVVRFLEAGDAVSVGFGSMVRGDAAARGAAFVRAARERGLRCLVLRGWGGADVPPELAGDDVLVVDAAAHAAVFSRVRAAVHHGGAGTTHAAVRAGAPSVVVPFLADQPFWARLLERQGLAAAPLPRRRVTTAPAGIALDEALACAAHAAEVGAAVAAEDGALRAIEVIERAG
jgi:sterol 3beta-glucosyltransferase